MTKLSLWKTICLVTLFYALAAIALPAQIFTTLLSFDGTDGTNPSGTLVQGFDGNFYSTTVYGGVTGYGTVFKITPSGTLTTLYSFCSQGGCPDGAFPEGGWVQAKNRSFYGTTSAGGANGGGTVFKITPGGTLTTLYSFCSQTNCTDGEFPDAGLVQATNGDFYGTTAGGGANSTCTATPSGPGCGTVFKITPGGTLNTLYSFCAQTNCTDGANPYAGLVQATNGSFYGTTYAGGANGLGTVFEITQAGTLTTLHSFDGSDGENPVAGLAQASSGNFYGTAEFGGANNEGTAFKITPGGTLTTLHSFDVTDGANPEAWLVQATNGNFYGTTASGGAGSNCTGGCGTVFEITAGGTLTTLHSFDDPSYLRDGLVQATNGNFYGTTGTGGASRNCSLGCGTVFSLSVGLGPFVETHPRSGKVGATVMILGNNLTGSTSVTFNGTPATFTVNSTGTAIATTVPSGATTGKVQVTTPSRTLTSNVNFQVP